MANYVKSTDFAAKDSLLTGDPLKIVSGTEIDDEYNAIQTAINSKANANSPSLTGSPTAPTASSGTNTTQIATTSFVQSALTPINTILAAVYPVGSIYTNATNSTNPGTLLGFGTWEAFVAGRVMVGFDSTDTRFDTAQETGGSFTSGSSGATGSTGATSLTVPRDGWGTAGGGLNSAVSGRLIVGSGNTEIDETLESLRSAGGDRSLGSHTHTVTVDGHTHSVLQPYITVYLWRRTA